MCWTAHTRQVVCKYKYMYVHNENSDLVSKKVFVFVFALPSLTISANFILFALKVVSRNPKPAGQN